MTISYNNNVPAGPNNPSVDQPQMLLNTQALNSIIAIDHSGFNSAGSEPGGYHEIIHQIQQGTWIAETRTGAPAATAGFNEVVSLLSTPDAAGAVQDTQLFNITGNGGVSQLTGNRASNEGYVWAGGIMFQWGKVTLTSGSPQTDTVLFKEPTDRPGCPPFPRFCFMVIPGLISVGPAVSATNISVFNVTNTQFEYQYNTTSIAHSYDFYWVAIGQ